MVSQVQGGVGRLGVDPVAMAVVGGLGGDTKTTAVVVVIVVVAPLEASASGSKRS